MADTFYTPEMKKAQRDYMLKLSDTDDFNYKMAVGSLSKIKDVKFAEKFISEINNKFKVKYILQANK